MNAKINCSMFYNKLHFDLSDIFEDDLSYFVNFGGIFSKNADYLKNNMQDYTNKFFGNKNSAKFGNYIKKAYC